MMNSNVLASDQAVLIGSIDPDAYAAGTEVSAWVSLADFAAVSAVALSGAVNVAANIKAPIAINFRMNFLNIDLLPFTARPLV